MSAAKAELGRHLFYDLRLSGNHAQSCATCHQQERAFTDGLVTSAGSTGQDLPRNSMSLVNVAYAAALTWGNPKLTRLEDQALVPMFGTHPVELGLGDDRSWLEPLRADARYVPLFTDAFPGEPEPFTRANVVKALATFQRTIVSARSPYDRYHFAREDDAVPAAVRRGEVLFHSRPLSCFTCHGGVNFSSATTTESLDAGRVEFHNTGLYNLSGLFSYPPPNTGIFEQTRDPRTSGSSRRRRCATSPSPLRTCTTAASRRSKRSSHTTKPAEGRLPMVLSRVSDATIRTRALRYPRFHADARPARRPRGVLEVADRRRGSPRSAIREPVAPHPVTYSVGRSRRRCLLR